MLQSYAALLLHERSNPGEEDPVIARTKASKANVTIYVGITESSGGRGQANIDSRIQPTFLNPTLLSAAAEWTGHFPKVSSNLK
jgi:hypothetical protein